MVECHCGKDGHPLGSINCQVHGTWRPIETAPKDGTDILGCWKTTVYGVVHWFEGDWIEADERVSAPTHWMQIPDPPETNQVDGGNA